MGAGGTQLPQLQPDQHDLLAELVVQLAGDALSFPDFGGADLCCHRSELPLQAVDTPHRVGRGRRKPHRRLDRGLAWR
jgi:hypothetical protein